MAKFSQVWQRGLILGRAHRMLRRVHRSNVLPVPGASGACLGWRGGEGGGRLGTREQAERGERAGSSRASKVFVLEGMVARSGFRDF